jgi:hypothetical protein
MSPEKAFGQDLNLLFWSEDERNVDAENVRGKCYVRPEKSILGDIEQWTVDGQYRFYYKEVGDFVDHNLSTSIRQIF